MKVLILTNGHYGDYTWCQAISSQNYDYVICADNGMKHARKLGIIPDLIVGDFDSCNEEDLAFFRASSAQIYQLPCEKDETDTEIALDLAIEKGATALDVYGGVGTRFDHSIGNIHLLYKTCKKDITCWLMNDQNKITLIDKEIILSGQKGDLVSLLPLTEQVKGVTTSGLAYSLVDGTFCIGKPYGVSNYMTEEQAKVTIKEGLLLVILAKD